MLKKKKTSVRRMFPATAGSCGRSQFPFYFRRGVRPPGTVCRGRKQCANESVDIANNKALAAKSFFLRYL